MTAQRTENERLRDLLKQAALLLDWSQSFAKGRPGTDAQVQKIGQLLGAIYYALEIDLTTEPALVVVRQGEEHG